MSDLLTFVVVGLAAGSLYGLAGTGLVLTFKTSGIFNFAHGAVAALGAYAFYELHELRGVAWPLAGLLCLVVLAPLAGLLLERLARGLREAPASAQIVATVGLLLAIQGFAVLRYGAEARFFPPFLPTDAIGILGARIGWDQIIVVAIATLASVGLAVFFRRTRIGAQMRAVVDDPALLDLAGTDPVRVRRTSWAIGAAFAALSGILIAPSIGLDAVLLTFLVVQAFGAAALGRFTSLLGTYLGGLAIGVLAALATRYLGEVPGLEGLPASLPFVVLFVVLLFIPARRLWVPAGEDTARRAATPIHLSPRARWVLAAIGAGIVVAIPALVGARLPVFTNAVVFVIMFLSLALLVNLSGQVSLCHAAFAAVGATTFAHATGAGLPWLVALLLAGAATVPLGAAVAVPAIRLSGLYLALATFGLGILLERMAYDTVFMFGEAGSRVAPRPGWLSSDVSFYYLVLVFAVGAVLLVIGLRRARLGRLLAALADHPLALGVLGTDTNLTRLIVFCVSAFLAGTAGALLGAAGGSVSGVAFGPMQSLLWLAVLALGGRGLVGTAVIAAVGLAVVPAYLTAIAGDWQTILFGTAAIGAALATTHHVDPVALAGHLDRTARWRLARSPVRARLASGASR